MVKEYIIYTTEGHTIAPNEEIEVDNCQVLGFVKGENANEAKANLLNENSWIVKAGFSEEAFVVRQLVS